MSNGKSGKNNRKRNGKNSSSLTTDDVKKIARGEIDKEQDTHYQILTQSRFANNNDPNPAAADLRKVLPDVVQAAQTAGPGSVFPDTIATREGDKIRLKTLNIKGYVNIPPDDTAQSADRAQIWCRLVIFSDKKFPLYETLQDQWASLENRSRIFLKEGANPVNFDGSLQRIMLPVNRAAFTVHHEEEWIMSRGQAQTYGATLGGATTFPGVTHKLNIKLKVKNKELHYATPTRSTASNYGPNAYLMFAYLTGAPGSSVSVPYMQFNSTISFKDD